MIGVIIHAHIVVVFFRSHGNPGIFKTHRFRFIAVPIILFSAMLVSEWVLISVAVLFTFWDVYHSGAQTFGFGRIYDLPSEPLPDPLPGAPTRHPRIGRFRPTRSSSSPTTSSSSRRR